MCHNYALISKYQIGGVNVTACSSITHLNTCVKGYKSIHTTKSENICACDSRNDVRFSFHMLTNTPNQKWDILFLHIFSFSIPSLSPANANMCLFIRISIWLRFFLVPIRSCESHLSTFSLVIFSFICTFKLFFCVPHEIRKWMNERKWTNERTFLSASHARTHTHTNVI